MSTVVTVDLQLNCRKKTTLRRRKFSKSELEIEDPYSENVILKCNISKKLCFKSVICLKKSAARRNEHNNIYFVEF